MINQLNCSNFKLTYIFKPMDYKAANNLQDLQYFGEYGGVNPSISDSSTYTFISAKTMFDVMQVTIL